MANVKRRRDKRLAVARKMPLLKRREKDGECDSKKDEVIHWVMEQPELLGYLFDQCRYAGYVEYDPDVGVWKGIDYEPRIF